MSNFQIFTGKRNGKHCVNDVGTRIQSKKTKDKVIVSEGKQLSSDAAEKRCMNGRKTLDVYLNLEPSLKGWTENSEFPYQRENHLLNTKHLNSVRSNLNSVYCEVLNNGDCYECQSNKEKLTSISSSLSKFPDLETGGYLLYQSFSEKHKFPERTTYSALSFSSAPAVLESNCSSLERSTFLRRRVRAASAVLSDFRRKAIGSVPPNLQARPLTSQMTSRFDEISRTQASLSSRASTRKISPMSQEGWSKKQIEAWKLLAPTPPQIEVSQMNVSMYTPKELPGIKIFDESLFVI